MSRYRISKCREKSKNTLSRWYSLFHRVIIFLRLTFLYFCFVSPLFRPNREISQVSVDARQYLMRYVNSRRINHFSFSTPRINKDYFLTAESAYVAHRRRNRSDARRLLLVVTEVCVHRDLLCRVVAVLWKLTTVARSVRERDGTKVSEQQRERDEERRRVGSLASGDNEVPVQGGTSVREAEGRGRENPTEISGPSAREYHTCFPPVLVPVCDPPRAPSLENHATGTYVHTRTSTHTSVGTSSRYPEKSREMQIVRSDCAFVTCASRFAGTQGRVYLRRITLPRTWHEVLFWSFFFPLSFFSSPLLPTPQYYTIHAAFAFLFRASSPPRVLIYVMCVPIRDFNCFNILCILSPVDAALCLDKRGL